MISNFIKKYGLSGNILKIIAALFMLIDHMGLMLFPTYPIFRILGRISFPIFAFMIAEGCHYTKCKWKYFLSIFILGVGCQVAYYIADRTIELGILITFSISILIVFALQFFKQSFFAKSKKILKILLSLFALTCLIVGTYFLCKNVVVDYGFWGCLAPAFASLIRKPKGVISPVWDKIDNHLTRLVLFGGCLVLIALNSSMKSQIYSLFALILLLLYSGRRGRFKMKYFFYLFYPLHFAVLYAIVYFIR